MTLPLHGTDERLNAGSESAVTCFRTLTDDAVLVALIELSLATSFAMTWFGFVIIELGPKVWTTGPHELLEIVIPVELVPSPQFTVTESPITELVTVPDAE